jgi:vanillate O-demethylase ferredoxin subunit
VTNQALSVRINAIEQLTSDVRSYHLTHLDHSLLPSFDAGAHIDIVLPNGLIRQYSLCSSPDNRDCYQIAVLQDPHSRGGSNYIHQQLMQGDTLQINPPRNHFTLEESAENYLLIAGGIGITPIMLMAYRLQQLGKPFSLHYLCRSPEQAAFAGQLQSDFQSSLHLHFTAGDASKRLDIQALFAAQKPETHLYTCGSEPLLQAILSAAEKQPKVKVHYERFSAVTIPEDRVDSAFEVEISSSGERLSVMPQQSILQVLEQAGHQIDTMCKEGLCGSCEVDILQGEADHRDSVLSEDEKAEHSVLMVCCSRAKGNLLVLDL